MRNRCSLMIFLVLLLSGPVHSAEIRITGTFTDLQFNDEGGDLLGTEILIVPSQGDGVGFAAFVQLAEGGAPYSVLVPLAVDRLKISFTLPKDGGYPGLKFIGVV